MSKIKDAFTKGKAFIPFISAGDHGIENTERYIRIMVKAGADMVEIGIPFSHSGRPSYPRSKYTRIIYRRKNQ